jgi:hypothetical protein
MSASEILEEPPEVNACGARNHLPPRGRIASGYTVEASPELLAAIDDADESFVKQGGVNIDDARRIVASWNTK